MPRAAATFELGPMEYALYRDDYLALQRELENAGWTVEVARADEQRSSTGTLAEVGRQAVHILTWLAPDASIEALKTLIEALIRHLRKPPLPSQPKRVAKIFAANGRDVLATVELDDE